MAEVRRDEWPLALGFAAYFFLVIMTFWILKPVRTSQFLGILGAKNLPWARLVTALVVLPVASVMAYLSARLAHRMLLGASMLVFGIGHFAFWILDPFVEPAWIHVPFYFWVDVYVTANVALFWSFLNEHTTPADAKRLYGLIGAGGLLGGVAGTSLSGFLATTLGGRNLLLLTVATTAATFPVLFALDRRLRSRSRPEGSGGDAAPADVRKAWDGATMVMRSRFLLGILAVVGLYEISSVLADFQFSTFVMREFPGEALADDRIAYLGRFAFVTGLIGLAIQVLGTSAIQRRLGVGAALLVMPLAMAGGIAAFLAVPALWSASLWFGADSTLNYGIHQSSKEVLYTPTSVDVKYRAKAFIDIFGVRLAKAAGAAVIWAMIAVGSDARIRAAAALAILALWVWAVLATCRRFERALGAGGAPTDGGAPDPEAEAAPDAAGRAAVASR